MELGWCSDVEGHKRPPLGFEDPEFVHSSCDAVSWRPANDVFYHRVSVCKESHEAGHYRP